jgi:hypothetical protein
MLKGKKDGDGLFKSVFLAYMILALHVLLFAGLALLVLFLRGIVQYMIWIFLGGSALVSASAYFFYKRMKAEGRSLRDMLKSPLFHGRAVEISLLGGLASFKLGQPQTPLALESGSDQKLAQLEDPVTVHIRELTELARLLENDLITREEYNRAKAKLFTP